jgi:hypothetical protein
VITGSIIMLSRPAADRRDFARPLPRGSALSTSSAQRRAALFVTMGNLGNMKAALAGDYNTREA